MKLEKDGRNKHLNSAPEVQRSRWIRSGNDGDWFFVRMSHWESPGVVVGEIC
jgi:hypothetical protein